VGTQVHVISDVTKVRSWLSEKRKKPEIAHLERPCLGSGGDLGRQNKKLTKNLSLPATIRRAYVMTSNINKTAKGTKGLLERKKREKAALSRTL